MMAPLATHTIQSSENDKPVGCEVHIGEPDHQDADDEAPVRSDDRDLGDDAVETYEAKDRVDDRHDRAEQDGCQEKCSECVHGG